MAAAKYRADPKKSLVGFTVGGVAYAIPITRVREIVNPLAFTGLPHAHGAVLGVTDHRGEVLPLIDLRVRFGLPPPEDGSRSKWILVTLGSRTVGLVVDRVTDVFGTGGAPLRPPPQLGAGEDIRGIEGVATLEGEMVFVLDLSRLETVLGEAPALPGSSGTRPPLAPPERT